MQEKQLTHIVYKCSMYSGERENAILVWKNFNA